MVLAITSHVPHLIAYNIVATAAHLEQVTESEVMKFAAGGFRDFTRIAASDPTMWRDVFLNNKDAVLEMLGRFTEDLTALQRAIRFGDGDKLFDLFTRTRAIRRAIIEAGQETAAPDFGRPAQDRLERHCAAERKVDRPPAAIRPAVLDLDLHLARRLAVDRGRPSEDDQAAGDAVADLGHSCGRAAMKAGSASAPATRSTSVPSIMPSASIARSPSDVEESRRRFRAASRCRALKSAPAIAASPERSARGGTEISVGTVPLNGGRRWPPNDSARLVKRSEMSLPPSADGASVAGG